MALQQHPRYEHLNERQQEVIDCFAAGMGYKQTAKLMGTQNSAPWSMLRITILPRYKPNIWKITKSLPTAIQLIAEEVRNREEYRNAET